MKLIRKRLTYANVMSSIAVFLVLGGATAFAAKKIGSNEIKGNSITTGKLKKESVTKAKLKKASVDSSKLADDAVTTAKIAKGAVTGEKLAGAVPDSSKLAGKGPASYESKAFHVQTSVAVPLGATGTTAVSSLDLPAGTYAIFGRGSVNNNGAATAASGANSVRCNLAAGTDTIEVRNFFLGANGDPGETEDFDAHIVSTLTAPGTATLSCTTDAFSGNVITPEITAVSVQP